MLLVVLNLVEYRERNLDWKFDVQTYFRSIRLTWVELGETNFIFMMYVIRRWFWCMACVFWLRCVLEDFWKFCWCSWWRTLSRPCSIRFCLGLFQIVVYRHRQPIIARHSIKWNDRVLDFAVNITKLPLFQYYFIISFSFSFFISFWFMIFKNS